MVSGGGERGAENIGSNAVSIDRPGSSSVITAGEGGKMIGGVEWGKRADER